MNFLIIGGLLIFALVAILVAVLLGMGEQRSENARAAEQSAIQPVVTAPTAPGGPVAPAALATMEAPAEASQSLHRTVPLSQGLRLSAEQPSESMISAQLRPPSQPVQPAPSNEPHYAPSALNGQMHLFAEELRSLQQQAWELEQRLQGLSEMLDHLQASSTHLNTGETTVQHFPTDAM
jgi:hypothetical protein